MLVLNYLLLLEAIFHKEHREDVVKYRNATWSALAWDFFHFSHPISLRIPGPPAYDMEMTLFFFFSSKFTVS